MKCGSPIPVRDRAREPDGVGRAARGLGVVLRVRPQLERDRDRVSRPAQQRGDRRVDAAAHRHQRALGARRAAAPRRRGGAQRAVQRVGGQVGGVELAGRQPAELGGDRVRADARRVEHVRALDERHRRRAGGGHRPAAGGLEAGGGHPLAVDPQRDADQVAAGGAAGAAVVRAGRARAAPGGMLEVLAEGLHEHRVLGLDQNCEPQRHAGPARRTRC